MLLPCAEMPKSHFANPLRWLGADTKIQSSIISSEFYKNFSANLKSGIPGRNADAMMPWSEYLTFSDFSQVLINENGGWHNSHGCNDNSPQQIEL